MSGLAEKLAQARYKTLMNPYFPEEGRRFFGLRGPGHPVTVALMSINRELNSIFAGRVRLWARFGYEEVPGDEPWECREDFALQVHVVQSEEHPTLAPRISFKIRDGRVTGPAEHFRHQFDGCAPESDDSQAFLAELEEAVAAHLGRVKPHVRRFAQ